MPLYRANLNRSIAIKNSFFLLFSTQIKRDPAVKNMQNFITKWELRETTLGLINDSTFGDRFGNLILHTHFYCFFLEFFSLHYSENLTQSINQQF